MTNNVKDIKISSSGNIFLLNNKDEVYFLLGNTWLKLTDNVKQLLFLNGEDVVAVKNSGLYLLNGDDEPLDILPVECHNLLNQNYHNIKALVEDAENLWIITQQKAFACTK